MLVSDSGQCQPLKHLMKHRETAPNVLARAYAFRTSRGMVIARIEGKTANEQQFNSTMRTVKAMINQFVEGGEEYG